MGIVCEKANFCGSETDSMKREKNCLQETKIGATKMERKKKHRF